MNKGKKTKCTKSEISHKKYFHKKVTKQVQTKLFDFLSQQQVEVVQVEVPLTTKTNNPWLDKFGCFKDDPTFDDLQNEIAAYRQEIDQDRKLD